jgi:hypothetical protein
MIEQNESFGYIYKRTVKIGSFKKKGHFTNGKQHHEGDHQGNPSP